MSDLVFVNDFECRGMRRLFDHGIYLYGSTCSDETGLVMTFAHELQHFVQYAFNRRLWAEGRLATNLPRALIEVIGLNWPDIPHEREARIVAKRIGVKLCGADTVSQYIDRRINCGTTVSDTEDWRFIKQLDPSISYDLSIETKRFFQRLSPYRQALVNRLRQFKENSANSDYEEVDLSGYFDEAETRCGG
jgi:hypothetical protein